MSSVNEKMSDEDEDVVFEVICTNVLSSWWLVCWSLVGRCNTISTI